VFFCHTHSCWTEKTAWSKDRGDESDWEETRPGRSARQRRESRKVRLTRISERTESARRENIAHQVIHRHVLNLLHVGDSQRTARQQGMVYRLPWVTSMKRSRVAGTRVVGGK
jgi:hypothetical protein